MKKYVDLMEQAEAWIQRHRQEMIEELQSWASFPSVSREDLAVPGMPFGPDCRHMLNHAMARGQHYQFRVEDHQGYACSIRWGNEDAIGIIAHLDVVPAGDGWVYPPYGASYLPEHDVMIGRGVDDNKGSAIAGLFAMRFLREIGWPMKHGLRLICGTSEETGMQDMQYLKEKGMAFPKVSLVPDAGFPVNYGQKGSIDADLYFRCEGNLLSFEAGSVRNVIPDKATCIVALPPDAVAQAVMRPDGSLRASVTIEACAEGTRITATGRAGHAAFPQGADNAIMRLAGVLAAAGFLSGPCAETIRQVAELTADPYGQSEGVACRDEDSGELTLVYGVAHLDDGMLSLSADCRYPISADGQALEADLLADWQRRGAEVTGFSNSAPYYIPVDDPRVLMLQQVYQAATGRDDKPYTMGGGTYSRVVPDAISFGPGMTGQKEDWSAILPQGHGHAHGRDEVIAIRKLTDCFRIYVGALAALDDTI